MIHIPTHKCTDLRYVLDLHAVPRHPKPVSEKNWRKHETKAPGQCTYSILL